MTFKPPKRPVDPAERMTPEQWEWWSCKRKQSFDRKSAKRVISRTDRLKKVRLFMYKCEFCRKYHLTRSWTPKYGGTAR